MVDMAHFAGLVAGKVFTGDFDPVAHAQVVTTTTHKTLRGPRGGLVLCKNEFAAAIDKGCPAVLGGPLPHVMAAKAVALREAAQPEFADYAAKIVDNAQVLAAACGATGAPVLTGGTDNHMVLVDVTEGYGLTGRQAESALRACGHHPEPQLAAVRRQRPLVHQRPAAGHAGRDHAGHGRGGTGRNRRHYRPDPGRDCSHLCARREREHEGQQGQV